MEDIIKTPLDFSINPDDSPKFSIIVPVYNREKYLVQCLDSLCNQTTKKNNYEIIAVDDGSTDSSGKILDDYAAKFPFIQAIHTKNFGVSHARNIAISKSNGDYIAFCDSDDVVSPQLISVLTKAAELHNDADIFSFKYMNKISQSVFPVYDVEEIKPEDFFIVSSEDFCIKVISDQENFGGYLWNKAIKRNLFQEIHLNENLKILEDHHFFVKILNTYKNLKIFYFNFSLYCYMQRDEPGQGVLPSVVYEENGMSGFVKGIEEELKIEHLTQKIKEQLEGLLYYWSTGNMYQMGSKMNKETKSKISLYLKNYAFKYYFKSLNPFSFKLRALVRHVLILFHRHKYKC